MLKNVLITLLSVYVFTQQPAPVLRGTWTATVGPTQIYYGSWSGQLRPGSLDSAQGSWVIVNASNQIVLEGTWSAERSVRGWEGTWSARPVKRASSGQASPGRALSGTWQAAVKDFEGKTLADMLQRTFEEQVSGSWRSGRLAGSWSLRGSR